MLIGPLHLLSLVQIVKLREDRLDGHTQLALSHTRDKVREERSLTEARQTLGPTDKVVTWSYLSVSLSCWQKQGEDP